MHVFGCMEGGTTTTSSSFKDMNGDGLPDFVSNGTVFYNHGLQDGKIEFSLIDPLSTATASTGSTVDTSTVSSETRATLETEYYRDNPIRMWRAPYKGTVSIAGTIALQNAPGTGEDGVRCLIYKANAAMTTTPEDANGESSTYLKRSGQIIIRGEENPPLMTTDPQPFSYENIAVDKNDEIYFMVDSVDDGNDDTVIWAPNITYTSLDNNTSLNTSYVDTTGSSPLVYNAGSDYTLAGSETGITMPQAGTVKVTGSIYKTKTIADDVTLEIVGTAAPQTDPWNGKHCY